MLETQSTVCVMLHCICLITWNPPPTLASSGLCWVKRAKREICTCDNSNAHLQTKLVGKKNCSFVLCLQPMRQLRPAPTSPCSLASSCWCHSWVWPCIARTAGAHRECARSWRPLWLSTCCTWNSSCGAAGYGWPCSDWDRPQGETWGLLYVFSRPLFFPIMEGAQAHKHLRHLARLCTLSAVLNHSHGEKEEKCLTPEICSLHICLYICTKVVDSPLLIIKL